MSRSRNVPLVTAAGSGAGEGADMETTEGDENKKAIYGPVSIEDYFFVAGVAHTGDRRHVSSPDGDRAWQMIIK
jgi:hypothetical protein